MSKAIAPASAGITPDRETFVALAAQGNLMTEGNNSLLIPVFETLIADSETPVSIYRRLDAEEGAFLLESVEGGEKWGAPFEMMPANKKLLDEAGYADVIRAIKAKL